MTYYKVLDKGGRCYFGGVGRWYLPTRNANGAWKPGKWMPAIEGDLVAHENGYHLLCRDERVLDWLGPEVYEAEPRGELVETEEGIIAREARLLRRLNWNDQVARLFAADCAERALPIFERERPGDGRPRRAIEVARLFAEGRATAEELADAARAARDAALDIATGVRSARDAAYAAAEAADWDAARAARDAAGDARGVAWAAAWAAAGDVTSDARNERVWQYKRLAWYVNDQAA